MNPKEKLNKSYIDSKLSGIFEPMVNQIFAEKPDDFVDFIIKFLKENYGNRASINENERKELEFLRHEVHRLKNSKGGDSTHDDDAGSEHHSEGSEDDDYIEDLPKVIEVNKQRGPRTSVSAEAFGNWNKKQEFVPPSYEKTAQQKAALKKRLEQSFMFNALNPEELDIVLNAMQNVKKQPGDLIIQEGDDGDNLYVVESGQLDCTKVIKGEVVHLKVYQPGEAFGELALLYNCPRAATIKAKTEAELWSLDRRTFNHIVKDAAAHKREKYEEFLKKVKILQNMDAYERSKLADAIKEEFYDPDQFVIREGAEGNTFYMIMSGEAIATKTLEPGKPPIEVFKYKSGDYFGELALIRNEPRAANIIATSKLQVVSLDRHSFKRLLGPIEGILKRNMDLYKQFY